MNMYQIDAIIKQFVHLTTGVQSAVLVSDRGELLHAPIGNCDENVSLALTATMLHGAQLVCSELGWNNHSQLGEEIKQVTVEGKKGYVTLVSCGENIALLVIASKTITPGFLSLVINRTLKKLQPLLIETKQNQSLDKSDKEMRETNEHRKTSLQIEKQSDKKTFIQDTNGTSIQGRNGTVAKASGRTTTKLQDKQ